MWKRTFALAFVAQILSILGFSFALPFMPFFIAELGAFDTGQQAFWSGVAIGATGITLSIFAPLWGVLADRYGRKAMVCRSMFAGALVLLLMSMARTVGQLVFLRLMQGALTGTMAASIALVASVTPVERSGFALGMMQAAVSIGVTLGPLIGGIVADMFGYRAAFIAGAGLLFFGGLLITRVKENFTPPDYKDGPPLGFLKILAVSGFFMAVVVMFGVRLSESMVKPSFPLIVEEILPATAENLNSITGMVMAVAALSGAISAALLGHMGDRIGQRRILIACCLVSSLASIGHFFAYSLHVLVAVRIMYGFSVAGMLPAANAMIQKVIDKRYIGRAYGVATCISTAGIAIGPFLGGTTAQMTSLRVPFLVVALTLLVLALVIAGFIKAPAPKQ